jgi:hypothetical protein
VPGYSDADGEVIAARLRDRVGQVTVSIETVDMIPLEANGKFKAVVSRLGHS